MGDGGRTKIKQNDLSENSDASLSVWPPACHAPD